MAKWELGSKVREGEQQVVWCGLYVQAQEEWDKTGAQNEQVAHQQEGS